MCQAEALPKSTATNTVRLHRVLRASPERVYRAFLDPDAIARWLPPNGFTGKVHHMDACVGGGDRRSFANFETGTRHSFTGRYTELDIVQEGLPLAIPVELCHLGWQESLLRLAHLVEPEIPDGASMPGAPPHPWRVSNSMRRSS